VVLHNITDLSGLHETTIWICLVLHEMSYFAMEERQVFISFCMKARCTVMLHTGTDISEITKSGFVWFCKKAPQLYIIYSNIIIFFPNSNWQACSKII